MSVLEESDPDTEEDSEIFRQHDLPLEGFPVMSQIRGVGRLCDIKLKVEGVTIDAHRIVLAGTIPYFHAMFTSDMKESRLAEVELLGLDSDAVQSLINFAYSGEIAINTENCQRIMMVASFLQLTKVKDACANFLIRRLSIDNVLGVRSIMESLNCSTVVLEADKYIQRNFVPISRTEEFLQLGITDIINILSRDELNVDSEEQVYNVMMDWVSRDTELRGLDLPTLLKCVRLPLLSPQFITDKVATEPLIRRSHECRDLLDEARNYYLMPERRLSLQTFKTKPRYCDDVVGYIYVVGGLTKTGDAVSTVEIYDPTTQCWSVVEAMKMLRSRVGVAVMRNLLYAVGGFNGQERLNICEVYKHDSQVWSKTASMGFRRSAIGCCALNDRLFVCGGYDGTTSLNNVECYFPEEDSWKMMTPMIRCRSAAGVVALQNYIYALGGHDGTHIFNTVERYDYQCNQWALVNSMKSSRCRLGAAALNGKLYCCGGYDGSNFLSTVECYDPETDEWSDVAPMNVMRSRVVLISNGGRLYALGGYDGLTNLSTCECYDPATNVWTLIAPMCAHEGGVGAAVIPMTGI